MVVSEQQDGVRSVSEIIFREPTRAFLWVRVVTQHELKPVKDVELLFFKSDRNGKRTGEGFGKATTDEEGIVSCEVKGHVLADYICSVAGAGDYPVRCVNGKEESYQLKVPRGYLSVRLLFRNGPLVTTKEGVVKGLNVKFFAIDGTGKQIGDALKAEESDEFTSDDKSHAALPREVMIGNYACVIEGKYAAQISSVERPDKPYIIELPVGREQLAYATHSLSPRIENVSPLRKEDYGYLAVRVLFRNEPLSGLKLKFYAPDRTLLRETTTDINGLASLDDMVKVSNYFCEMDDKHRIEISSVERKKAPYIIAIPLSKPNLAFTHSFPSSTIDVPDMRKSDDEGYLCVRIIFRNQPLSGVKIGFYGPNRMKLSETSTDGEGIATQDDPVKAGNYLCSTDGKYFFPISTTVDRASSYAIMLPGKSHLEYAASTLNPAREDVPALIRLTSDRYLSVKVMFRNQPMVGLNVKFLAPDRATLIREVTTDNNGIAAFDDPVRVGNYYCKISDKDGASVSTVENKFEPQVLTLPLGRPNLAYAQSQLRLMGS